jgi:hypothetical protein
MSTANFYYFKFATDEHNMKAPFRKIDMIKISNSPKEHLFKISGASLAN